jgi:hypothetical protein
LGINFFFYSFHYTSKAVAGWRFSFHFRRFTFYIIKIGKKKKVYIIYTSLYFFVTLVLIICILWWSSSVGSLVCACNDDGSFNNDIWVWAWAEAVVLGAWSLWLSEVWSLLLACLFVA